MNKVLIEVDNYSFRIYKNPILTDVSFSVYEGDYISIIGPNGAGKSTLLVRIYTGGSGKIILDGKSLESYNQKELAKLIGYVPQGDFRNLDFTVYEFVMMGRYPYLSPFTSISKEDKKKVSEALALTEIEHLSDRFINTLSGGERQNVFISAAIAQESRILLLDEPTTFLDPRHQYDIHQTLKRANKDFGITIVSVTHDINYAVVMSRKIIVLKEGSVAFSGQPSEVMNNDVLEKVYDKKFIFAKHPLTGQPVIVPGGVES